MLLQKIPSTQLIVSKEEDSFHVCFDHGAGLCEVAFVDAVETREGETLVSPEQAALYAKLFAASPKLLRQLTLAYRQLRANGATEEELEEMAEVLHSVEAA